MGNQFVPFQDTGRFSSLICDYLSEEKTLQTFYGHSAQLNHFAEQIELKKAKFPSEHRHVIVDHLKQQYSLLTPTLATQKNIEKLNNENTFTVTTGHQLCLMTGPLYFIYKIISTINLCRQLKSAYPQHDFVPVYWMASEDHDFEEISTFRFQDKRIQWPGAGRGAVGERTLEDLQDVLTVFENHLGNRPESEQVKQWIKSSYKKSNSLSEATLKLVDQLFGKQGLVVLEPNAKALKNLFLPQLEDELMHQKSYSSVRYQIDKLKSEYDENYAPQVNPREINLFYLTPSGRYRIEKKGDVFVLHGTEQQIDRDDFLTILKKHPERFSPNVILRPVYQEVILPNLCYIGGGGELAYWFQLKSNFERFQVPFPILLLRNSVVLISEKEAKKISKLKLTPEALFLKRNALINKKIRQISNIDLDLSFLKKQLDEQFSHLEDLVNRTDKSFKGAVEAQKKKQFKGIEVLEKRLIKAQKRVLADEVHRLVRLHEQLFPDDSLQERELNFVTFYLELGESFFDLLFKNLDPLRKEFILLEY